MRFVVYGVANVPVYAVVEASTAEEARLRAEEISLPSLCHQCAAAGGPGEWHMQDSLGDCVDVNVDLPEKEE